MQPITISRKITAKDDLVVLPRKEYEALLSFKRTRSIALTATQKKALTRAERNLQKNKTLSHHELATALGITS